ncbi:MAG: PEGA domain-containing protein [Pseudomonadota bacterium]|nr:PEGA domain-containing protein [Pseudomonadota bacterium]
MKYTHILILIAAVTAISGCASIVSGTDQALTFNSEPDEATVTIAGKVVGKTPLSVQLKKVQNQSLTFEKEGYKTYTTQLSTRLDGWFWGNILLGGVIGSTTDGVSGAMHEYSPDKYFVTLTPEAPYGLAIEQSRKITEFVVAFGDEIRLELAKGGGEKTDTLLEMIGAGESEKTTMLTVLQKLSVGNEDDVDFARAINKIYILK